MSDGNQAISAAALNYLRMGWSIIPMKIAEKKPAVQWKGRQSKLATESQVKRWFAAGKERGLAVVFGAVSGNLASRDFDTLESYERWAAENTELAKTLATVETRRGRHVYFTLDPEQLADYRRRFGKTDGNGAIAISDGELRADVGCYSCLPPSIHPSGFSYKWIIPPSSLSLILVDFEQAGFVHHATERPEYTEEHRDNRGLQKTTEAISGGGGSKNTILLSVESVTNQVEQAIIATTPTGPGKRHRLVFEFARALKSIPALCTAKPNVLRDYVEQWHNAALPFIETEPFVETWIDFLKAWPNVKFPMGEGTMTHILELAKQNAETLPESAKQYEPAKLRLLVSLCRELQRQTGSEPFFLATRTAGKLLKMDHTKANRWLFLLESEGVITCVVRGGPKTNKATRYRYMGDADDER